MGLINSYMIGEQHELPKRSRHGHTAFPGAVLSGGLADGMDAQLPELSADLDTLVTLADNIFRGYLRCPLECLLQEFCLGIGCILLAASPLNIGLAGQQKVLQVQGSTEHVEIFQQGKHLGGFCLHDPVCLQVEAGHFLG